MAHLHAYLFTHVYYFHLHITTHKQGKQFLCTDLISYVSTQIQSQSSDLKELSDVEN